MIHSEICSLSPALQQLEANEAEPWEDTPALTAMWESMNGKKATEIETLLVRLWLLLCKLQSTCLWGFAD